MSPKRRSYYARNFVTISSNQRGETASEYDVTKHGYISYKAQKGPDRKSSMWWDAAHFWNVRRCRYEKNHLHIDESSCQWEETTFRLRNNMQYEILGLRSGEESLNMDERNCQWQTTLRLRSNAKWNRGNRGDGNETELFVEKRNRDRLKFFKRVIEDAIKRTSEIKPNCVPGMSANKHKRLCNDSKKCMQ